jgi:hypothetical protein
MADQQPLTPPGWGTPGYAEAITEAATYLAARAADCRLKDLIVLVRQFKPLTFEVVRWLLNHGDACTALAKSERASTEQQSLSWHCRFCSKLRIYEGGRPQAFSHLDTCQYGSRVATTPHDRAAIAALIDKHLL